jgi:hypothetical protein
MEAPEAFEAFHAVCYITGQKWRKPDNLPDLSVLYAFEASPVRLSG